MIRLGGPWARCLYSVCPMEPKALVVPAKVCRFGPDHRFLHDFTPNACDGAQLSLAIKCQSLNNVRPRVHSGTIDRDDSVLMGLRAGTHPRQAFLPGSPSGAPHHGIALLGSWTPSNSDHSRSFHRQFNHQQKTGKIPSRSPLRAQPTIWAHSVQPAHIVKPIDARREFNAKPISRAPSQGVFRHTQGHLNSAPTHL